MSSLGLKQEVLKARVGPPSGHGLPLGKNGHQPLQAYILLAQQLQGLESFIPNLKIDWPGLGHMLIPEPITLSKSMAYTDWPGLSHMLTWGRWPTSGRGSLKDIWVVVPRRENRCQQE